MLLGATGQCSPGCEDSHDCNEVHICLIKVALLKQVDRVFTYQHMVVFLFTTIVNQSYLVVKLNPVSVYFNNCCIPSSSVMTLSGS